MKRVAGLLLVGLGVLVLCAWLFRESTHDAGPSRKRYILAMKLCDGTRREMNLDLRLADHNLISDVKGFLQEAAEHIGESTICPVISPAPNVRVYDSDSERGSEIVGGFWGMRKLGSEAYGLLKENEHLESELVESSSDLAALLLRIAEMYVKNTRDMSALGETLIDDLGSQAVIPRREKRLNE
jgi:hypothetical protein